jgi:hypothetical protein
MQTWEKDMLVAKAEHEKKYGGGIKAIISKIFSFKKQHKPIFAMFVGFFH